MGVKVGVLGGSVNVGVADKVAAAGGSVGWVGELGRAIRGVGVRMVGVRDKSIGVLYVMGCRGQLSQAVRAITVNALTKTRILISR